MATVPDRARIGEFLLFAVVGVPVLGLLMGGVYWVPAVKLTREKDPWLTGALALGLASTIFGGGAMAGVPSGVLASLWVGAVALLLVVRRGYGGLGHSLERFGLVHALALVATGWASVAARRLGGAR